MADVESHYYFQYDFISSECSLVYNLLRNGTFLRPHLGTRSYTPLPRFRQGCYFNIRASRRLGSKYYGLVYPPWLVDVGSCSVFPVLSRRYSLL